MRVISGTARGRKLAMVPGETTRPITDRTKEALFNILGSDVRGSRWLDLFAGTGAVGIEALSRGAAAVTFIDRSKSAIDTIHANLTSTGLSAGATVQLGDAFHTLRQPPVPYDFVYVAPPQYRELWLRAMDMLSDRPAWLAPGGWVIVQIHPNEARVPDKRKHWPAFALADQRKYGSTLLLMYAHAPGDEGAPSASIP